jgi:hypothetical protein
MPTAKAGVSLLRIPFWYVIRVFLEREYSSPSTVRTKDLIRPTEVEPSAYQWRLLSQARQGRKAPLSLHSFYPLGQKGFLL